MFDVAMLFILVYQIKTQGEEYRHLKVRENSVSAVVLQDIYKNYGPVEVVHGIDLEVAEHEFVVLVGPSGCGKSTTLRMIAGLEEITAGELTIGGRIVNRIAPKDRDVAMVFQNYALYPHLSVFENIAFGLRIRRVAKDEINRLVPEVAEILGLTDYLQRRPAELSGGQRQRVAMGRAIVRHPKVFLFDEPLSNLDAKLRAQMRAEIRRLHNRLGVTSIYVTHDQVEAMTLADRIVVMNDGHIEQIGTPMELFLNPVNTFVAGFIGSPPMNQFAGEMTSTPSGPAVKIGGTTISVPDTIPHENGQKVVLGIRPEHVDLQAGPDTSPVPIDLDLVELLGSEALLHAELEKNPFIIKADIQGDVSHLQGVAEVHVPAAMVKVFDNETGKVMTPGPAS